MGVLTEPRRHGRPGRGWPGPWTCRRPRRHWCCYQTSPSVEDGGNGRRERGRFVGARTQSYRRISAPKCNCGVGRWRERRLRCTPLSGLRLLRMSTTTQRPSPNPGTRVLELRARAREPQLNSPTRCLRRAAFSVRHRTARPTRQGYATESATDAKRASLQLRPSALSASPTAAF